MATLSPTITLKDPKLGHGGSGIHPPTVDGGGDGRDDNGFSDYGARLRRARLGTIIALVAVVMIFVALTSAYVVRRGLPVMDDRSGNYVRDWMEVNLPTALLLVNTFVLLVSSLTAEFARRQITRRVALVPVESIPGVSLAGGVLALLYAAITSLTRKPVEARRIVVDVTVWYWHFMALLWIYIFALLEFAR